MSTRSYIGIERKPGEYECVYCHFDGYLSYVGEILSTHYQDKDKIEKLLSMGDISSLGNEIDMPDGGKNVDGSFGAIKDKNVCLFYTRDRGDEETKPFKINNLAESMGPSFIEYCYIYSLDNEWKFTHDCFDYQLVSLDEGLKLGLNEFLAVYPIKNEINKDLTNFLSINYGMNDKYIQSFLTRNGLDIYSVINELSKNKDKSIDEAIDTYFEDINVYDDVGVFNLVDGYKEINGTVEDDYGYVEERMTDIGNYTIDQRINKGHAMAIEQDIREIYEKNFNYYGIDTTNELNLATEQIKIIDKLKKGEKLEPEKTNKKMKM